MKIRINLVIFLLISFHLFSIDVNTDNRELVKYFSADDKNLEALKFQKPENGFAGCFPTCFTITNNKIYVCDSCKRRIAIYDLNLNFLGEIKNRSVMYADSIKISDNEDIYLLCNDLELLKINAQNEVVYSVYGIKISSRVFRNNNYFPVDNYVFFYNSKNELFLINDKGEIVEKTATKQVLSQILTQNNALKETENSLYSYSKKFAEDNNLLIIDNKLYNPSITEHENYFKFKKQVINNKSDEINSENTLTSLNLVAYLFIGYDQDNNSYWRGFQKSEVKEEQNKNEDVIIILDDFGNVLDYFSFDRNISNVCISSAGDFYFMITGVKVNGVAFYKIPHRW